MLKKQIHCPACNSPSSRWIRYAYSSWLFPVACLGCGERFYLGYTPLTYILLWFLVSPLYLACLLFLTVTLVPTGLVLPAFLAMGFASMPLLIYLGQPTAKKVAGEKSKLKAENFSRILPITLIVNVSLSASGF